MVGKVIRLTEIGDEIRMWVGRVVNGGWSNWGYGLQSGIGRIVWR